MNASDKKQLNQDSFEILKNILKEPNISQRKLSKILGFSLGKLNYCIKQLTNNGLLKISNNDLKNNKKQYLCTVTAAGVAAKKKFTFKFVNENIDELDKILNKKVKNKKDTGYFKSEIKKIGIGHNSSSYNEKLKGNTKRTKPLFKTIEINIKRRTVIVDDVLSNFKGYPIPSWIELSIIDVCNRSCSFCPKSDPKIAPDTHQRMSLNLINKLN